MNEGVGEGGERRERSLRRREGESKREGGREREGRGKDRWEKGLGEGGGVGIYRNLRSSVMGQGAEGQLGRNCSRCGQVACWFGRPSGAHLGGFGTCQSPG